MVTESLVAENRHDKTQGRWTWSCAPNGIRDHGSDPDGNFRKAATGAPVKASHCESESSDEESSD